MQFYRLEFLLRSATIKASLECLSSYALLIEIYVFPKILKALSKFVTLYATKYFILCLRNKPITQTSKHNIIVSNQFLVEQKETFDISFNIKQISLTG